MKHRAWILFAILIFALLQSPLWPILADDGAEDLILRESYVLKSGERRSSDLTVVAGKVELQEGSLVEGTVVIVGSEAAIDGEVTGNVIAWGGQVSLGPAAVVHGDAVILGTLRRHENAQIMGAVIDGLRPNGVTEYLAKILPSRPQGALAELPALPTPPSRQIGYTAGSLTTLLMILGGAALVITLLPTQVGRMGHAMGKHAPLSLGVGALTIILVLVLLPILIILCLGIPFAIVLAIAFTLCGVLGWVAAGRMAGRRMARTLRTNRLSALGETLLGTLIITLLSMVPCAGFLLALAIVSWGVGGAVLTRLGTSDYPPGTPWAAKPTIAQPAAPEQHSSPAEGAAERTEGTSGHPRRDTRPLSEAEIWRA